MITTILTSLFAAFIGSVLSTLSSSTFDKKGLAFRLTFTMLWIIVAICLSGGAFYRVGGDNARQIDGGISIPVANRPDLEGKVIRPISVTQDGGSLLLIGSDRRLYSLLGVQLEPNLTPSEMVDKNLIVYRKGKTICIGRTEDSEIPGVPAQIGPTNK